MLQDTRRIMRNPSGGFPKPVTDTLKIVAVLAIALLAAIALGSNKIGVPGDVEHASTFYGP
jgi:hypothetical protein